jgi:hypothetical protein
VLSPDKFAHAFGSDSEFVREGIRDVDAAIARLSRSPSQAGGAIRCVCGWWAIMDTPAYAITMTCTDGWMGWGIACSRIRAST